MQCKSGNQSHWFTASCSPGCFNCEPPVANRVAPKRENEVPVNNQEATWEEKKRAEVAAEQRQFRDDLNKLKGQLKGIDAGSTGETTLKSISPPPAAPMAPKPPTQAPEAWTPQQCDAAQRRLAAYRQSFHQVAEIAQRLSRSIATDQGLRSEWEETMTAAVERAKDRGQFLWLALPLGKLQRINELASKGLEKNAGNLADLLAGTTDTARRNSIRIARQFNAREKNIVDELGKAYGNIDDALTLGGNAPLMFEDPSESPTSILHGDGMKLREAGDMLFNLIVEREKWQRIAANSPWAKYLAGGLGTAFATEAATRAMFDSWYDALATGLAWKQINAMNMNAESYLSAVKKLDVEMRKRSDRLKTAQAEFSKECSTAVQAGTKKQ